MKKKQAHMALTRILEYVIDRENTLASQSPDIQDFHRLNLKISIHRKDWPEKFDEVVAALKKNLNAQTDDTYDNFYVSHDDSFEINFKQLAAKLTQSYPDFDQKVEQCKSLLQPLDTLKTGTIDKLFKKTGLLLKQSWLNNALQVNLLFQHLGYKNLGLINFGKTSKNFHLAVQPKEDWPYQLEINDIKIFSADDADEESYPGKIVCNFSTQGNLLNFKVHEKKSTAAKVNFNNEASLIGALTKILKQNLSKDLESSFLDIWLAKCLCEPNILLVSQFIDQLLDLLKTNQKEIKPNLINSFTQFFNEARLFNYAIDWRPVAWLLYEQSLQNIDSLTRSKLLSQCLLMEEKLTTQKFATSNEKALFFIQKFSKDNMYLQRADLRMHYISQFANGKISLAELMELVNLMQKQDKDASYNFLQEIKLLVDANHSVLEHYHLNLHDIYFDEFITYLIHINGKDLHSLNKFVDATESLKNHTTDEHLKNQIIRLLNVMGLSNTQPINDPHDLDNLLINKPLPIINKENKNAFVYFYPGDSDEIHTLNGTTINFETNQLRVSIRDEYHSLTSGCSIRLSDSSMLTYLGQDNHHQHHVVQITPVKDSNLSKLAKFFADAFHSLLQKMGSLKFDSRFLRSYEEKVHHSMPVKEDKPQEDQSSEREVETVKLSL